MKLLIGDTFPTMAVRTTKGDVPLPDEFAGHWFVFFSHPGDFTPVCTTEFVGFQKRCDQFARPATPDAEHPNPLSPVKPEGPSM